MPALSSRVAAVAAAVVLVLAGATACSGGGDTASTSSEPGVSASIRVTSQGIEDGKRLPTVLTCDGGGVSPSVQWTGLPDGTAGWVLVVDDPDAPGGTFVHWIVGGAGVGPGAVYRDRVPDGAEQAKNSAGKAGWTPPCPPGSDEHRYRFTVHALDAPVDLCPPAADPTQPCTPLGVDEAMRQIEQHTVAIGRLTATYGR